MRFLNWAILISFALFIAGIATGLRTPLAPETTSNLTSPVLESARFERIMPKGSHWHEDLRGAAIMLPERRAPFHDKALAPIDASTMPPSESDGHKFDQWVLNTLTSYHVVRQPDWISRVEQNPLQRQEVSSGWLVLRNHRRLAWLIAPGGVAALTYPDGGTIFLCKKRGSSDGPAVSAAPAP